MTGAGRLQYNTANAAVSARNETLYCTRCELSSSTATTEITDASTTTSAKTAADWSTHQASTVVTTATHFDSLDAFLEVFATSCFPACALNSSAICEQAAIVLNVSDQTVSEQSRSDRPFGCWVSAGGRLQYNTAVNATAAFAANLLCSQCKAPDLSQSTTSSLHQSPAPNSPTKQVTPTLEATTLRFLSSTVSATTLKLAPRFVRTTDTYCRWPLCTIETSGLCADAAAFFNASDLSVSEQTKLSKPPGCWETAAGRLQFNTAVDAVSLMDEVLYCKECSDSHTHQGTLDTTTFVVSTSTTAATSPKFNCPEAKLSFIGDGYCDTSGDFNTEACDWDGGDCCAATCSSSSAFTCGTPGFECRNPLATDTTAPPGLGLCMYPQMGSIGDGYCDDLRQGANVHSCAWDGGDCCEHTCRSSTYTCGVAGYVCRASAAATLSSETSSSFANVASSPSTASPAVTLPTTKVLSGGVSTSFFGTQPVSTTALTCVLTEQQVSYIGDGFCDEALGLNTAACSWDGGDCCVSSCQSSIDAEFECGFAGYTCRDASVADLEAFNCKDYVNTTRACFTLFSTDIFLEQCQMLRRNVRHEDIVSALKTHFEAGLGWDVAISPTTFITCGSMYINVVYKRGADSDNWRTIVPFIESAAASGSVVILDLFDGNATFTYWTQSAVSALTTSPLATTLTAQASSLRIMSTTTADPDPQGQNQNEIAQNIEPETWTAIYVSIALFALIVVVIVIVVAIICCKQRKTPSRRVADDGKRLPELDSLELRRGVSSGIELMDLRPHSQPIATGTTEAAPSTQVNDVTLDFGSNLDRRGPSESKATMMMMSPAKRMQETPETKSHKWSLSPDVSPTQRSSSRHHAHQEEEAWKKNSPTMLDGPPSEVDRLHSKLAAYFRAIGKSKFIAKIPEILNRNRGKERRLCLKLTKKYGGHIDTSDLGTRARVITPTRTASLGGHPRTRSHKQPQTTSRSSSSNSDAGPVGDGLVPSTQTNGGRRPSTMI